MQQQPLNNLVPNGGPGEYRQKTYTPRNDCYIRQPCYTQEEQVMECHTKKKGCQDNMRGWGWLAFLIVWFIVFTVIFWLIFYSLRPSWVLQPGTNNVDMGRVLLASVVAAIILILIIWLIKVLINASGNGGSMW
jgi:hypothetical protein